jgi:hypothetical protein
MISSPAWTSLGVGGLRRSQVCCQRRPVTPSCYRRLATVDPLLRRYCVLNNIQDYARAPREEPCNTLATRYEQLSRELHAEAGEELLLVGKRFLRRAVQNWCSVHGARLPAARTHASPALCAYTVPTRNKGDVFVFCVEAHNTLELGASQSLVCARVDGLLMLQLF